jgi:hypothetical protein
MFVQCQDCHLQQTPDPTPIVRIVTMAQLYRRRPVARRLRFMARSTLQPRLTITNSN